MLTPDVKDGRIPIFLELLNRFGHEGDAVSKSIVAEDESWVNHYDPEAKQRSVDYRYKDSPSPKKSMLWHYLAKKYW